MEEGRHFAQNIEELRDDLKGFIETRYDIFRADLRSTMKKAQGAFVLVGAAIVLAMLGLLLLGFCAALAVALAFGALANHAGIVWGFLIVGAASLLLGVGAGVAGRAKLKTANLAPKRTLFVLSRDKQVLQGGPYGDSARFRRHA
jgi:hypothetical protein